tara:strand:- start:753 stop:950 length:198 start_codon:yes stop_codon:yes gene_type:complete
MKKKNEKKILLNNEFIGFIDFTHLEYFLNTVYDCIGKDNVNNNYLQKLKLGRIAILKNSNYIKQT